MLGKAIDHLPEFLIGLLECRLRSVALDSDKCESSGPLNHSKVDLRRQARLSRIDRERPENLVLFRQDRLRPRRAYPIAEGKVATVLPPAWLGGDIWDNHTCLQECGSSAQSAI